MNPAGSLVGYCTALVHKPGTIMLTSQSARPSSRSPSAYAYSAFLPAFQLALCNGSASYRAFLPIMQRRGDINMASVRYIVEDIDESVSFYRDRLGFAVEMHNPGKFAALKREGRRQRWQGRG
jgi:hypothetical protein